ncbi:ABC transporter permease [Cupriavidus gilardii]|uniref:ABC transporter permease n=1 Tax=Cupriavidus gilardii TaxID=82541 RepID=UPI001ABE4F02|nr:ABC transporter permease [Cupriavidus gilardii]MBO4123153.1 ABC transporter permease [Cupriavidus gilardii]
MSRRSTAPSARALIVFALPALIVFLAFFCLPMAKLLAVSVAGDEGAGVYWTVLSSPRYLHSLLSTVLLSASVTLATLAIAGVAGTFLQRHAVPGKSILVAMLTFPLAFPGVVIGFMVIMLGGRNGLLASIGDVLAGERWTFAYGMTGLFVGYLYFSIPRVILTVMAAVEKLDTSLEEAARSLGASRWRVVRDVMLPALMPAMISSGAICFATSMGAFGTAFTLATQLDVLPLTIYNEFTNYANFGMAAALSILLGAVTWALLALARHLSGNAVAATA